MLSLQSLEDNTNEFMTLENDGIQEIMEININESPLSRNKGNRKSLTLVD